MTNYNTPLSGSTTLQVQCYHFFQKTLDISRNRMFGQSKNKATCLLNYTHQPYSSKYNEKVLQFFKSDHNSQITTGTNNTISHYGKKQRCYFCWSLLDSFKKFCNEYPNEKIFYASFCVIRQFWTVAPNVKDRAI